MSVTCKTCGETVETPPKMPFQVLMDGQGKPFVPTNFDAIYEHIRDQHPELWTDAMAAEYQQTRST